MASNPFRATWRTACHPNTVPARSRSSPPFTRTPSPSRPGSPTCSAQGTLTASSSNGASLLRQIAHAPDLGMAPLARFAGDGQDHPERDRVPYPHQPPPARIPPNPPRGPPPHLAPALRSRRFRAGHEAISIDAAPLSLRGAPPSRKGCTPRAYRNRLHGMSWRNLLPSVDVLP